MKPITSNQVSSNDIAVIGMSCRFPQAPNLESYWQLLAHGQNAVTPIPPGRWGDHWFVPHAEDTKKSYSNWSGSLVGIDLFDPFFFQISPREAELMDPQQRLFLELSWEALEHGGYQPEQLATEKVGVFVGCSGSDVYYRLIEEQLQPGDHSAGMGNQNPVIANRVSYFLNLSGPSLLVDTLCSSSLVSVHLACQSIRQGECTTAIAGGVRLHLSPEHFIGMSRIKVLSPTGQCYAFDDRADGIVLGEGGGAVLLKSLDLAFADGDHIYGVIKGSAVNNDGRTNGLMAPSPTSQAEVVRQALDMAGVSATTISYVEAHGTGTQLGDPFEIEGLTTAFRSDTDQNQFCAIGSVKTNIGHLEAAAGMAQLIKVLLCLEHQQLPPSLNFERPNPLISFDTSPFFVNTQLQPWVSTTPLRAGISSLGMGGTNAHIVMEAAPTRPEIHHPTTDDHFHYLFTISAKSKTALNELVDRYQQLLTNQPTISLADLCFTANTGRVQFSERLAIVTHSVEDLITQLSVLQQQQLLSGSYQGFKVKKNREKIAFLFTGQGSQYVQMGHQLYVSQPIFRQAIEECAAVMETMLQRSLLQILYPQDGESDLMQQSSYAQPALFALEYALFQLWKSWGIAPKAVLGHSLGEYVAAVAAGVMTLADAAKLVISRAKLMQDLPEVGKMVAVFATPEKINDTVVIDDQNLTFAIYNSPENTVISGNKSSVEQACELLGASDIKYKVLTTTNAFHSPLMEPIILEFQQVAATITYHAPQIPLISNLTGLQVNKIDAEYWCQHLRQSVRFADGIQTLAELDINIFLEIGPKPTLIGIGQQCLAGSDSLLRHSSAPVAGTGGDRLWLNSLRFGVSDEVEILHSMAQLFTHGVEVDWLVFGRNHSRSRIALPTYPFQRKRYWLAKNSDFGTVNDQVTSQATSLNSGSSMIDQSLHLDPHYQEILSILQARIARLLKTELSDIDINSSFLEMGADSLLLVEAVNYIERTFDLKISIRQIFEELTTIDLAAKYIHRQITQKNSDSKKLHPFAKDSLHTSQNSEQPQFISNKNSQLKHEYVSSQNHDTLDQISMVERIMEKQLNTVSEIVAQQLEFLQRSENKSESPLESKNGLQEHKQRTTDKIPVETVSLTNRSVDLKTSNSLINSTPKYFPTADLQRFIDFYTERTSVSKTHTQHYRDVLADSRASAGFRPSTKELTYPIIGDRAKGSRIWDVDGNEYIDLTMGFGVLLFGHNAQSAVDTIHAQVDRGLQIGPQSQLAGEVAKLITELTGSERVAFCNSGTEAVMTAIRLARATTGRHKIALFTNSYHGHFDGILVQGNHVDGHGSPLVAGIPPQMASDVMVLEYGNPHSLELLQLHAADLAAVLVEPVQSRNPALQPREFLQQLRQLTKSAGIALIFDEVLVGFRIHPGGAQAWFDVQADIVTYGKIVGGGLPIGVVAGRAHFLNGIDGGWWNYGDTSYPAAEKTFFAGTFNKNHLGMAVAKATLQQIQQQGDALQKNLNQKTQYLATALNDFFQQSIVPIQVDYFGSLFRFSFHVNCDLFFYHLLSKGIYIWEGRSCFLSTAHTDEDIQTVIQAVKDAVRDMQKAGYWPKSLLTSTDSDQPITEISYSGRNLVKNYHSVSIQPVQRNDGMPLSFAQQRLWLACQLEPNSSTYNMPGAVRLQGHLNCTVVEKTLREILCRHEALRTNFISSNGQPMQVVRSVDDWQVAITDLQQIPVQEQEAAVQKLITESAAQTFSLDTDILVRANLLVVSENEHVLLILMHHIASDGWSMGIFIKEFSALYSAFVQGKPSPLPDLKIQYVDFAMWQRDWLQGEILEKQTSYWQKQLANAPTFLEIPADRPRPPVQTFQGAEQSLWLPSELTSAVTEFSRRSGYTLFMTLLAAFNVLISRYTGKTDILIGSGIANRHYAQLEELIGFFVNTLVMRADLSMNPSFQDLLVRVKESVLSAYAHQDLPFELLVNAINPERTTSHAPLIQVAFVLQNVLPSELEIGDLKLNVLPIESTTAKLDLTLSVEQIDGELVGRWEYNTDLFNDDTITRMAGHFQTLLTGIVANPECKISELPLLTLTEQHLFTEWNSTRVEYPQDMCIHHLVEMQSQQTPDAIAVVCKNQQLTYGELNVRANQFAYYLMDLGVQPGMLVGICVERSLEAIIGILGILKAGGAYVPLDPTYPLERLHFMLSDAQVSILVTQQSLVSELPEHQARVVCLDGDRKYIDQQDQRNPEVAIQSTDVAYVIYTSGSTGIPKGVLVPHRGLGNLVQVQQTYLNVQSTSRILQFASLSFDGSVWEIVMGLATGATLYIDNKEALLPGEALLQYLQKQEITHVTLPPTALAVLPLDPLPHLQTIIVAGEACPQELIGQWSRGRLFINGYGPTEGTVCTTMSEPLHGSQAAPIGRPIQNVEVYILDPWLQPLPIGIPGEIHIGGVGLAIGYLNRPDLTATKFISHPFSTATDARLYKTGDLARYLPDGNIEYLGRIDNQVKIRGFRIELEEIEALLCQHPAVQQTAVITREDHAHDKRLVAYVVANHHEIDPDVPQVEDWQSEYVADWQNLYEQSYQKLSIDQDLTFNITGWNSSYTGLPIPAAEMQEWVEATVQQILALQPQRVLEIGCGSGLLLSRIAPHCDEYWGTDYSAAALQYIEQMKQQVPGLEKVVTLERMADNFQGIEPASFDTVIINSVIQYFPSIHYLLSVLEQALSVVKAGGRIVIGDVRNLLLLDTYVLSVQLHQSPDNLTLAKLQQHVRQRLLQEEELLVDPEFFFALQQHLPRISQVLIRPKCGQYHNELTKFRYEVILEIESIVHTPQQPASIEWWNWQQEMLTVDKIRELLVRNQLSCFGISCISNKRLDAEIQAVELLQSLPEISTVQDLRQALSSSHPTGIDPAELWSICLDLPYNLELSWSNSYPGGRYDAVFQCSAIPTPISLTSAKSSYKPWNAYGNNPLQGKLAKNLIPRLRDFLVSKLPSYMVPAAFMLLESMPLTANGKIDRQKLPAPEISRSQLTVGFVAPRNSMEETLAVVWQELLGIEKIGIHDNFFALGGHSLLGTQLISRIRGILKIELPLQSLFGAPTIAEYAQYIQHLPPQRTGILTTRIQLARRDRDLPLSFAQQRLWFFDRLEPNSFTYNMPGAIRLQGQLNISALEKTLQEIVHRHETLRTNYINHQDQPVQLIRDPESWHLVIIDLQHIEISDTQEEVQELAKAEAQKTFSLETDILIRGTLLLLSENENILLITMHHIASDGWSMGIFIQEVAQIYAAFAQNKPSPLLKLEIQYADFAVWQKNWLQGEILEQHLDYWRKQLTDTPKLLEIPTDRSRPPVQTFNGTSYESVIPLQLAEALDTFTQQEGVTLFMTLLAAFDVLLYRYSGQTDIALGSPIANRNHAEIENLIGFFVNTLVLRSDLSGNPTFRELIQRVREVSLGAYAHQDLPFEMLVETLQPERNLSHSPLFQVMFIVQNVPMPELTLPGVILSPVKTASSVSLFDLTLSLTSTPAGLIADWEYNTDLFDVARIERMAKHFEVLLTEIVSNPNQQISAIPLLTAPEQQQLLVNWNDTKADYPQDNIHQLFEAQVAKTPETIAAIFGKTQLTYQELNQRANQLASYLQDQGVKPEVLVGLCVERSLDMLVGMLAVLKAGGAYVPLDPEYPRERLIYMVQDASISILLTQEPLLAQLPTDDLQVICLDRDWPIISQASSENLTPTATPENLAYVIYTSGSTGQPKGVLITQQNLTNFCHAAICAYQITSADRILQFASVSFDVAAEEIYPSLMQGATIYLRTTEMLNSTAAFWQQCQDWQLTILDLPTAYWHQLTSELLNLPTSVRLIIIGGEPVNPARVRLWQEQVGSYPQLINAYGPTETTVEATCCDLSNVQFFQGREVPIGKPLANVQTYILDPQLQPVPVGIPGELHIGGYGVARGYWHRPDLTAEKFITNPFSNEPPAHLYKTGDLVRYLADGNIEYLGRIDQQVKIRGFRVELGEVEAAISKHPQVSQVTVIDREDIPGNKQLVAYIVPQFGQEIGSAEMRAFLQDLLPNYMVPAAVVCLAELPVTPNGKIDRQGLPKPNFDQLVSTEYEAPRSSIEKTLANIWIEVLGVQRVGIHDSFFDLGGHSLLATQLMSRLRQTFGVEVPLRKLFENNTIDALAIQVQYYQADKSTIAVLTPASRTETLPLSFAQQRLWFIDRLEPNSSAYNMSGALKLQGQLDRGALEKTLQEIIRRHEALRTNFMSQNGQPVQVINQSPWQMTIIDLQQLPVNEQEEKIQQLAKSEAEKPFALDTDSLLRATLLVAAETEQILLFTMHHIVSDGWSIGVLTKEIATIYSAFANGEDSPLPELDIQYADFAVWQRQWLQGETLEQQISYWQQQLIGAPALLELPTDRPRPPVQTYNGATHESVISAQLSTELENLSQAEGVTLFMTLLAAFDVLLYRYTGQTDIVVGSPIANRNHAEIENLIGFFVNTLVLRSDLSGSPTFRELLQRVREVSLGAYAHQDLPFEMLVETLQPERNLSHSPLFQVMFALQNTPVSDLELPGLTLIQVKTERSISTFDLTISIENSGQELVVYWEYNTDLFDSSTIERMANHFEMLLKEVIANPNQQISTVQMLTTSEQQQLLWDWNNTETDCPQDLCIHQLFEQQVEKTPDAIAVVYENEQITYQALNYRSNQLAYYLTDLGVKPDVLVGLCIEKSLEMIIGMLGILKAGGAYVPIDPNYPLDRLNFMLLDSQVPILLTQEHLVSKLPDQQAMIVCLDADWSKIGQHCNENIQCITKSTDLAYIIYTSGSTGTPKGVMLPHQGLCNLVQVQSKLFDIQPTSRVLQFASFSFDASVWEISMALGAGATLYLGSKEALLGEGLFNYLQSQEITHVTLLPAALAVLPLKLLPKLNTMIVGGEACSPELIRQWSVGRRFFNAYGPTEGTVCATISAPLDGSVQPVPIGKPIQNVQVYILDNCLQPLPIGIPGELHIGGVGIARGYFNRPELTAEKFIPHPYSDDSNARLYKTGDLARYLPDGNIEYLGRIDTQVKIRGFRVELGEVDVAISKHPQVSQVTVIDREDIPGNKQLVAYIVPQFGQEISSAEIRAFLKELLPNYMVPSAVVCLAEFPVTPNGKIDRQALPIVAYERELAANVLPKTEIEQTISTIWGKILGLAQVSIHDNFFEFGGNSLLAIQIITQLNENFQIDLPVRQIFANPTIAELALVTSSVLESGLITIANQDDTVDFRAEVNLDSTIGLGNLIYHHVTTPLTIFLSGATGFVGAFLLAELLQKTTADIYCLVRSTSNDTGKQRLQTNLEKYLLWQPSFANRIVVVLGDLSKPLLGLTQEQFQSIASKIDAIYHNGALVNHAYPYSALKATNVLGTEEILRLASQVKIKPVHFLSTISIFEQSGYDNQAIVYENDPLESFPENNDNGYIQSKWVAEKLMKIAQNRGLPCSIYRIARASWHSQTGLWNVNDIFYKFLQGCVQLNSFPDIDMSENLTPVDYLAKVLVCLSQKPDSVGQAFNLHSPHFTNLSTIAQGMGDAGYFLPTLPAQNWLDKLTEFMQDSSEHALYSYMVASGISPQTLSIENQGVGSTEKFDRQNVINALANTPMSWPEIDQKLMQKLLSVWILGS